MDIDWLNIAAILAFSLGHASLLIAIINRVQHPTWYGPSGVVPPGKNNPLGSRWMGLSMKGYGIHGTNVPSSIGKAASHGCIRMRQTDLEELFELVTVGTIVELQSEPAELLAAS